MRRRGMNALRRCLEEPNAADSFRVLWEQVLEDLLVGGFGAVEMEATGDPAAAVSSVGGRWRDHPDRQQVGRRSGEAALCAGDGAAGPRRRWFLCSMTS